MSASRIRTLVRQLLAAAPYIPGTTHRDVSGILAAASEMADDDVIDAATAARPPVDAEPAHDHADLAAERGRITAILCAVAEPTQMDIAVGMIRSGADIRTARAMLAAARTADGPDPWYGLYRAIDPANAVAADAGDGDETMTPGQIGARAAYLLYGSRRRTTPSTPTHTGGHP